MGILDAPAYSRAQADAKFAIPGVMSAVALGDSYTDGSITDNGDMSAFSGSTPNRYTWQSRPIPWLTAFSGQRLRVVRYAGVSGNTTAQMLARWTTDVAPYLVAGGWLTISTPGVNDKKNGVAAATTIANLTAMFNLARAAGVRVLTHTIPPLSNPAATSGMIAAAVEVNTWLRGAGLVWPGVYVADVHPALSDGTSADNWVSKDSTGPSYLTQEGIHPAVLGAARMGYLMWKAVEHLFPRSSPLTFGSVDGPGVAVASRQLLANPGLNGTGGTTNHGVTGTVPDNWVADSPIGATIAGAAAMSVVARSHSSAPDYGTPEAAVIGGRWMKADLTGSASRMQVRSVMNSGSGVTFASFIGQAVSLSMEVVLEDFIAVGGTTGTAIGASLVAFNASSQQMASTDLGVPPQGIETFPAELATAGKLRLTFRTPPFVLVTGTTALHAKLLIFGTGKVWIGRTEVRASPTF